MKRSERLEKIADINLGFENIAGASLSVARRQHKKQENQLEQLRIYKQEYQDKLKSRLKSNVSVTEIRDYQFFFSSLDHAINQQLEVLKLSAEQVELSKNNWLDKKQDVSKMTKAAEKLKAQEDYLEQEQEQKISDELNMQLYAIQKNNNNK